MEKPKATREDFKLEGLQRKGHKVGIYRSKLEQSWAMFFVEYGIPFIHEPRYYYEWLPDFELPDCRALIEVKPTLEIAREEVPRYYAGMKWAFYNEKRDIVLLVGRPKIDDYGASDNICGFADKTYVGKENGLYEVQGDWGKDFYSGAGDAQFVRCKRCEAYFFIGLGNWNCRRCDYCDGDQCFDTIFSRC
ncbi:hypothetical protein ES708_19966 [subsurface metagenome]